MKAFSIIIFFSLLALPFLAFAVAGFDDINYQEGSGQTPEVFLNIIQRIGNWLFTFLLALAVIMLLIAAYKYLFSGGGDKVEEAHKMIIYAVIAIVVGFLAAGIPWLIRNLVLDTEPTTGPVQDSSDLGPAPTGPLPNPLEN